MNKKRIDVTIPYELYQKYRGVLSFSGLLTKILEDITMIDGLKSSEIIDFSIINNSRLYHISITNIKNYVEYIKEVSMK